MVMGPMRMRDDSTSGIMEVMGTVRMSGEVRGEGQCRTARRKRERKEAGKCTAQDSAHAG